mmetsp:Transcript_20502/g.62515  ORF Transcript_20502/g.62515 Transcript_20502/m.62515 type:complete len:202 (+) Transcript_20502:940-1545(+)
MTLLFNDSSERTTNASSEACGVGGPVLGGRPHLCGDVWRGRTSARWPTAFVWRRQGARSRLPTSEGVPRQSPKSWSRVLTQTPNKPTQCAPPTALIAASSGSSAPKIKNPNFSSQFPARPPCLHAICHYKSLLHSEVARGIDECCTRECKLWVEAYAHRCDMTMSVTQRRCVATDSTTYFRNRVQGCVDGGARGVLSRIYM